jgi:hypothetical protein
MSPVALTVTVTVVVAAVAVGVGLLNVGPKPPIVGRATTFAKPFYYEVPGDSGLKLFPGPLGEEGPSDHLHVLATRNAATEGMSIWIVVDGLTSWCSSDTPVAPRQAGRDGLLTYLRSIPRLVVGGETPMTVDGRPAVRVDLTVKGESSGCPDRAMALWRDAATPSTGQAMWVGDNGHVRLIVFDVDEATIALEIWSPDNMANWVPRATAIVDTMQFISRPTHEVPPAASPSTP